MRPGPFQWALCLGALALSLWTIGILQAGGARAASADLAPERLPDPSKVSVRYHDFAGSLHRFTCTEDLSAAQQEEAALGYPVDSEANLAELDRRLVQKIKEQAGTFARYAEVRVSHDVMDPAAPPYSINWRYRLESLRMKEVPAPRQREAAKAEARIRRDLSHQAEKIFKNYLQEHGFDYERSGSEKLGRIEISYRHLGDRARELLSDCSERFVREAGSADEEELIGLLMAYFQEMAFELQPLVEDGRYTKGLWFPTKTLRLGRGDCDSRSLALCSMRRNSGPQMILLVTDLSEEEQDRVPPQIRAQQHVLIGIEAYPGFDQATVMVGLRRYVLCEAVGRDQPSVKLRPGERLFASLPTTGFCMTDDCYGLSL